VLLFDLEVNILTIFIATVPTQEYNQMYLLLPFCEDIVSS